MSSNSILGIILNYIAIKKLYTLEKKCGMKASQDVVRKKQHERPHNLKL